MIRLLSIGLVVALTCGAHAGGNPFVDAWVDFDPPNYVTHIEPEPYSTVRAYICLGNLDDGITAAHLLLTDLEAQYPSVCSAPSWVSLLSGAQPIPHPPWEEPGVALQTSECAGGEDHFVVLGYVELLYLGGSACLVILDHHEFPRWILDCQEPAGVDFYCVYRHGAMGEYPCPTVGDCPYSSPIEPSTWGTIKSMYGR